MIEQENEILDYEWWKYITDYFIALAMGIFMLGFWYYEYQSGFGNIWILLILGVLLVVRVGADIILRIFNVPKQIILTPDGIKLFFVRERMKTHRYEDITRLVIDSRIRWRTEFNAILSFSNDSLKVRISPEYFSNFPLLLSLLKEKGYSHLIEQR